MGLAVALVVLADIAVIGICVFYLARAGRRLDTGWQRQQHALDDSRSALERLIGDADQRAREFERVLGARERALRDLLYRLAEEEERVRRAGDADADAVPSTLTDEVTRLTAAGLGPVDVARELQIDPAQVRLMLDLGGERVARGG
jgi:hypothetical protein